MTVSLFGRPVPFVVAALATLAALPPVPAGAQPVDPAHVSASASAADEPAGTVTLITGDTVTGQAGAITVRGADGGPVGAHIITSGSDTYVYPDSALPYVGSGVLDKRLFNITLLLKEGYAEATKLPVILRYEDAATSRSRTALPVAARPTLDLGSIEARAVTTDRARAADFWTDLTGGASQTGRYTHGITEVWLDGKVKADLADTVAQIGAPEVWAGGNTGAGVDVAVLDTGVDAEHPDLAGQIEASQSFVPGEDVTDWHGHGTHVASTIAGTGAASDGREKGVAPGADLQIGKVLDNAGSGQDSWLIAGMEWAARERKAKVISMSLGAGPSDGTDPLSQAVNELSAETGALFVIAAGNSGPDRSTVGAPGAADAALTVGAVDSSDHLADFSSRGPRLIDQALKPEITAPGVNVLAARSQFARDGAGLYQTMSGTSMATPHVAGAAALLAVAHPDWTGQQLKDALVSTAKETPDYGPYEGGSGRVDIARTSKATVFATASTYLGAHPRNGEPTGATERQITYTNTGSAAVTLGLELNAPGVPQGMYFDGYSFDDLIVLPAATLLPEGSFQRQAMFAGKGTEADYADIDAAGKIAVVRRGDIRKQLAAAIKAGVTLLLVVNTEPGRFVPGANLTPLAVALLSQDEGDRLIRQINKGRVSLKVVSHPHTAYLYDLVRRWDGAIPGNVTYHPTQDELARVDMDFRSASRQRYEYRYDLNPDRPVRVGNAAPPMLAERFRTDWVTVQDSVRWSTEVSDLLQTQFSGSRSYRAGANPREQWLGPIRRPRLNDAFSLPYREGDRIVAEVPGFGDSGADHAATGGPGQLDSSTALYQGDTVVFQGPGLGLGVSNDVVVDPAARSYRLVVTTEQDPAVDPYSIRTSTTWSFGSVRAERAQLPLIQLDYAVETDLEDKAARTAAVTVTASHLPGGPDTAAIGKATLQVSYDDGATWVKQRMARTKDGWTTRLAAPAAADHVTLRAGAEDSYGNAVEQTITRAVGLR